jgi:N-acetylneuraminate synthase
MDKVRIGSRAIGPGEKVFIIAEAGINHDGDIARAHQLVEAAAEAGADAIKFQTHLAEAEMLNVSDTAVYLSESLFALIRRMELTFDQHVALKQAAERRGLIFLSTPFSREAVDLLEKVGVSAYKVGSGELTNLPLMDHIARTGKPMLISTGMSDLPEVDATVKFLKTRKAPLAVFQCTTQYPAKPEMMHLGVMAEYTKRFDVPVGLSDHSQGNYMSFAAVALGARMVERHFTISRSWPGPDQQASLEPAELADLVRGVRQIEVALDANKQASQPERDLQQLFRESVVTVQPVRKGAALTRDNTWVKRPGYGIPAAKLDEVIGRKLARDLKAGEVVKWEDLA